MHEFVLETVASCLANLSWATNCNLLWKPLNGVNEVARRQRFNAPCGTGGGGKVLPGDWKRVSGHAAREYPAPGGNHGGHERQSGEDVPPRDQADRGDLKLTVIQFVRMTAEAVVSRLVVMRHHFLALKICEYLKILTDHVLVHWACEKVKAATLVSYADIANCAEHVNRHCLATMSLGLEENASDPVQLLLSIGEFELALRNSLELNNTTLI
ncbi:Vps16 [Phytophthora infestans]|uniref:Vps16 n=2 Tax=Phytophthora infestans TaxID=4787 RepID=A0A833VXQ3_PHYIN|nr:Vps16 [Phytophthora infestans]